MAGQTGNAHRQVVELTVDNCPELRVYVEKLEAKADEVTRVLEEDHDLDHAAELLAELGLGMEVSIDVYKLTDRDEEVSCNEGTR